MKQFFLTVLGVFTGLILFLVVIPVVLVTVAVAGSSKPTLPTAAVLELDLREGISDQPSTNPFSAFGGSSLSVTEVVDGLAQAGADPSVKALLIRLPARSWDLGENHSPGGGNMSPALANPQAGSVLQPYAMTRRSSHWS